jgi:ubiquinone/menaquinone biosynthesis C-methylase UbiE
MNKPMPNLMFHGMSLLFKLRDLVWSRNEILKEAGIRPGFRVLDYGCGPGAYIVDAAERVGESGRVYALDLHPLAIQRVQEIARKRRLTNVETIHSDCQTGLPDASVDVVLLYDIFHMLNDPDAVLAELHRVLKKSGILSLLDPHMSEGAIMSGITNGQRFELAKRGQRTYQFAKREFAPVAPGRTGMPSSQPEMIRA